MQPEQRHHSISVALDQEDPWERLSFKQITIEDRPIFESFLSRVSQPISDLSFASIFMWSEVFAHRWRIVRDCLCLVATQSGESTMIFPPIGGEDVEAALQECLFFFKELNPQGLVFEYVPGELVERLGLFEIKPRSGDYVYETQKMIELKGAELASKRQSRNAFLKRYRNIYTEKYGVKHLDDCGKMLDNWQMQVQSSAIIDLKRSQEVAATKRLMANADALGLTGMVLYAEAQLIGFTFGEKLGKDSCSIMIEKTDRSFTGSAQYIFSEFCRQYWGDTQWCNAGDDWEIPALAWTKESYRPAFRIPKWSAYYAYEKGAAWNYACS
ncbi:MAG TPA: DUF2156 domain-containing protein [Oscillatoriaceae cyanobacterium M33_DOE_052]|uniref:DUF2156 domain-containing protein n=1 Tax=Planktothricoides sp. SpSt-374 TaxID=2282167 RepID=A0A7C3VSH1_9CYAN|nr:DUF2156 domain-containing protein [Oscillatoriaceae cyanobacterium M33_DOE_052]